jgi:hypothetical protein
MTRGDATAMMTTTNPDGQNARPCKHADSSVARAQSPDIPAVARALLKGGDDGLPRAEIYTAE